MKQPFTKIIQVAFSFIYPFIGRRQVVWLHTLACLLLLTFSSQAQTLKGRITGTDGEASIGAVIRLFQDSSAKYGALSGADGSYLISNIDPGIYTIKVTQISSGGITLENVSLNSDAIIIRNFILTYGGDTVFITPPILARTENYPPVILMDKKQIEKMPVISAGDIIAIIPGVVTTANGQFAFRGSRPNGTRYYMDGMFIGSFLPNIPKNMIEQIDVSTGGISAQYGDVTGGVVNITTRGPAANYFGSMELTSSQYLDPFGFNLLQGNIGGPLLTRKQEMGDKRAVLGFFAGGSLSYNKVADPPATDMYQLTDGALENLRQNPLRRSPLGSGVVPSAAYTTKSDMYTTRVKPNTSLLGYTFNGKLQYKPLGKTYDVTLGSMYDNTDRNLYSYANNMYNYENNAQLKDRNTRTYLRFHQYFDVKDTNSSIRQFYYTLQGDYQRFDRVIQDEELQDNYFGYGYIGKFDRNYTPVYTYTTDTVNGKLVQSNYLQGYEENGIKFTPGGLNPVLERYSSQFFDLNDNDVKSFSELQSAGGLINGQNPANIYSLWTGMGTKTTSYQKQMNEQYNFNASAVAISRNHQWKAGMQYQQMNNSLYQVGVSSQNTNVQGLWTLGRQLLNSHLAQLDKSNPIPLYSEGAFTDTINYNFQVNTEKQSAFDRNLRNKLIAEGARDENGRLVDEQTRLNIDQYRPEDLNIAMFSADELLNNGNSYVNYYGYDYLGNRQKGRSSLQDFLDPEKRANSTYSPVYMAGYVEDKFEFNKFKIRAGIRIDRFDANQPVLADPYSLYPVRSAGEVRQINNKAITHPGNIGDDYKVYVDDINNPTTTAGYRNGSQWYDASGAAITDPNNIALATTSGRIQPYLAGQQQLASSSFKDYTPQLNVMPRLSFSFPISDKANFFANYDVLTTRPASGNIATYDDYYYLQSRATLTIPNPDLKPERRINYEIGFVQNLSRYSSFSVQAYYAQIRDMVQRVQLSQAYPITYSTYGNVDFGNVKGFSFGYNLYREKESGAQLSLNYTLQFAEGTGSDPGTAASLINAGQPNLRTPFPLDYDRRHQITALIDYRFGFGKDYTGPEYRGKKWLEEAGAGLTLNALSGSPYTSQRNITQGESVVIGVANRSSIEGTVNGSRLPWQFRADLKFDKNFYFNRKKGAEVVRAHTYLNAYVLVQNVLDARNVVQVYRYTGLPDDDGYLQSGQGEKEASQAISAQAFTEQYSIKMNNPDNYISPRFIRLGLAVNF